MVFSIFSVQSDAETVRATNVSSGGGEVSCIVNLPVMVSVISLVG